MSEGARWLGDLMKKGISPVGIDVEISQLLLDVRSKTTNFQKRFIFYANIQCVFFFFFLEKTKCRKGTQDILSIY